MNSTDTRPNILLVVMDSVRRDFLSCYGSECNTTPVLDELAEQGTIYNRAYATGSWTVPVHGSLFTGKLPSEHGAYAGNTYLSATDEETLAGQFSMSGYDTVGFSTNPWLTEEFGYSTGFDRFFEIFPPIKYPDAGNPRDVDWQYDSGLKWIKERCEWVISGNPLKRLSNAREIRNQSTPICSAETVNLEVSQWLDERDADKPFFAFLNYMDAHEPYEIYDYFLPAGTSVDKDILDFKWNHGCFENGPDETKSELIKQIYGASVSYLDEQIGALFDLLKDNGDFENTIIVVMGDHGQSLGEHGYWGHGTFLYEELVNTPLIMRTPERSANKPEVSKLVSIADVPRALCEFAGFNLDDKDSHTLSNAYGNGSEKKSNKVLVESHGPYDEDDELPDYISRAGYRSIYFQSWRGRRDLETGEFEVEKIAETHPANDKIDPESVLLDIESNLLTNLDLHSKQGKDEEVSQTTQARLQDLGYI